MNNRIRELQLEAFKSNSNFMESYAELVVKECMNFCEQQRLKILNNPDDPSWTEHLTDVQNNIRQHFGVE